MAPWQSAVEEFERVLRRRGIRPAAVDDVRAAWEAFSEFAQIEMSGLDPTPDSDSDGLIAQWGRYSSNDNRLSLTFTRQLAVVPDGGHADDPDWQPEYWHVELEILFDDAPELMALDGGMESDTASTSSRMVLREKLHCAK